MVTVAATGALTVAAGSFIQRSNATLYQKQEITFHIWTDDFDEGDTIVPLLQSAYASQAFDWGTVGVTDFQQQGAADSHQSSDPEIKAWETVVKFTANTWQARTDVQSSSSSSSGS